MSILTLATARRRIDTAAAAIRVVLDRYGSDLFDSERADLEGAAEALERRGRELAEVLEGFDGAHDSP